MLGRISGLVLPGTTRRKGTAASSGNAYDFTLMNVLVAGQGVATVQFDTANELDDGAPFRAVQGELVDLLVEFGVYRQDVSCRLIAPEYPSDEVTLAALVGAA